MEFDLPPSIPTMKELGPSNLTFMDMRNTSAVRRRTALVALVGYCLVFLAGHSRGEELTLKNGLRVSGAVGKIPSIVVQQNVAVKGEAGATINSIILVDDELRRVYFPMYQVDATAPSIATGQIRIKIPQRVQPEGTKSVASVGPILRVTPFDDWGRRILTMSTDKGNLELVQGITLITPTFIQVDGLQGKGALHWNMKMSTGSLSREQLSRIIRKYVNPQNSDERVQIVQLFLQAERIQDARQELESVLKDFPKLADLQNQVRTLNQLGAQRLMKEIDMRRESGQHELAINMLRNFPAEGVAGEMLLKVREELEEYEKRHADGTALLEKLKTHLDAVGDARQREEALIWCNEMALDLNANNIIRLADYERLADDSDLNAEKKVALAISGWLMGNGQGIENLPTALSLGRVREMARLYLRSDRKAERDATLVALKSEEGATPAYVAKIIANMVPPRMDRPPLVGLQLPAIANPNAIPDDPLLNKLTKKKEPEKAADKKEEDKDPAKLTHKVDDETPIGLFEHVVAGLPEDPEIQYLVQLPPEYDPYRKYPVIFTLGGGGTSPAQQIEWWAGTYDPKAKMRYGQAGRHGYIVVAPQWIREHQRKYEYSAREHAAVLYVLRDVFRRYSVDTDRVYLSGHSMGGDAAWDIGISHPDLWAGVIPIVATADKYVGRYLENPRMMKQESGTQEGGVPLYFVAGQLDGSKRQANSNAWDHYLSRPNYDVMVVEYMGRGHEHFFEEVQNIFEWMRVHRRNFFPREFAASTMRPWDTFFWYAEIEKLPAVASLNPVDWDAKAKSSRAIETTGSVTSAEGNSIIVNSKAGKVTVWHSPELLNYNDAEHPPTIKIIGRASKTFHKPAVSPSLEVMLDDVRTRGDRLHPFWGKVEL